jgi:hypothetical protein
VYNEGGEFMEQVNTSTERSVSIGHGLDWVVAAPISTVSDETFQRESVIAQEGVNLGYDIGVIKGFRRGVLVGCLVGIAVTTTMIATIVLIKLKNDSKKR